MKEFVRNSFEDRRVRFLFVGVINTVFGYAVYALFIYLGLHYFLAQLFGSILAVAHSYLWNKYFTFRSPAHSIHELLRFISVYALSYLLNMLVLYLAIEKFKANAYIAGAISLFITTVISYAGHKSFSFKKQKNNLTECKDADKSL
jgi:putative flippase GtrA